MRNESQRGNAEIPPLEIKRPDRAIKPVREIEKMKTPETLSPEDSANLVRFIVDERKAMDKGLDEDEFEKTNDSLAEKEREIELLRRSLEAVRSLKEETQAVREKQLKRERSFWGGIAETFAPTVYPTVELNGEQQTMQRILSHLYSDMKIVFLNIRGTPFPDDDVAESKTQRALQDAWIHVLLNEKLKEQHATLSEDEMLDLFHEADQSPDLTRSQEQLKALHDREDALLSSFDEFLSEIERSMDIKIGTDRYGNMKIDRKK